MSWKDEVYKALASAWVNPYAEPEMAAVLDDKNLSKEENKAAWRQFMDELCAKDAPEWEVRAPVIGFTEEQWECATVRVETIEDISLTAYDRDAEDHTGPVLFEINMSDTFMYACGWGVAVPPELTEEYLSIGKNMGWLEVKLACQIEGLPPVNEVIERMEACGYIEKAVTDYYRQQMKDAGREDERW